MLFYSDSLHMDHMVSVCQSLQKERKKQIAQYAIKYTKKNYKKKKII